MTTFTNFVEGKQRSAADGRTLDIIDPVTEETYATSPLSGQADVDAAVKAAAHAFESWRWTTPTERERALLKIADAIEERLDELVDVECADTGKPRALTATEEIPASADQIRFFAGAARLLEGRSAGEYMEGHTSFVRREPVGVCAQVTPWNHPLMMGSRSASACCITSGVISSVTRSLATVLAWVVADFGAIPAPARARPGTRHCGRVGAVTAPGRGSAGRHPGVARPRAWRSC